MLICKQCGDEFQPTKKTQEYCRVECRNRSARLRNNEMYNRARRAHYARNRKQALRSQVEQNQ